MNEHTMELEIIREYHAKPSGYISEETAREIGPVLYDLAVQGNCTASRVVEEAKDPASPLHKHLNWDDESAATLYREAQARSLLGCVQYDVIDRKSGKTLTTRAFFAIRTPNEGTARGDSDALEEEIAVPAPFLGTRSRQNQRVYMTLEMVGQEEYRQTQIVEYAVRSIVGWWNRYKTYSQLMPEHDPKLDILLPGIKNLLLRAGLIEDDVKEEKEEALEPEPALAG